jgi:hypothetical protein
MAARMLHQGNSEYRRPFGVAISAPARNGHGRRHSAAIPSRRKRESARVLGYPDRAPLPKRSGESWISRLGGVKQELICSLLPLFAAVCHLHGWFRERRQIDRQEMIF